MRRKTFAPTLPRRAVCVEPPPHGMITSCMGEQGPCIWQAIDGGRKLLKTPNIEKSDLATAEL